MNGTTQNDLSYNHTKLDYQALVKTAKVAYRHSLNEIHRYYSKLQDFNESNTSRYLNAKYLATEADNLAIVADTLSTLLEALNRENLELVNKPIVIVD